MIATLRESKARLIELVALTNSGAEVMLTVHGQPKARLLPVSEPLTGTAAWLRGLEKFRSSLGLPAKKPKRTALDEAREDRW